MKTLDRAIWLTIVLGCTLLQASSLAQSKKPFRVEGKAVGLVNGEIYLSIDRARKTIQVKQGSFVIEGELSEPVESIFITVSKTARSVDQGVSLFIEPGNMTLTLNVAELKQSRLTGSNTQNDQYRLDESLNKIRAKYEKPLKEFDAIRARYQKAAVSGAPKTTLEKIKEEDFAIRAKLNKFNEESQLAQRTFIKENPNSYLSLYLMRFALMRMKLEEAEQVYGRLGSTYKNTRLGNEIKREIARMSLGIPGAKATYFSTTDINGKPVKLDDFKGKVLLVDFWASWCVPCRKGNPHLIELHKKYHDQGLEILGVSDDDRNPRAWREAVAKDKIGIWHHVLRGRDPRATFEAMRKSKKDISNGYNIRFLPTKILIGPDGVVIGRYCAGYGTDKDLDKKLVEIFEKK